MTPLTLAYLQAAHQALTSGRPDDAREMLAKVIRMNGGCVPTAPWIGGEAEARPVMPLWMRTGR
jgi:hypothetical protein